MSHRKNLNRQMADFNMVPRPANQTKAPQQTGVVPMHPVPTCELHQYDDNRSEYSVRTHSQFGTGSNYFSASQPAYALPLPSPMSHAVHNRDQQVILERYLEKAQKHRSRSPCKSPGRERSIRSGSQQRMY